MDELYDYKRFAILYVDDEEKSLKLFARAFCGTFRILTARDAKEALKILEDSSHRVGVLMTDQRMPGEKGVWLLEQARHLQPQLVRILATAYSDMEAAINAVNSGAIYKYVSKPWDPIQLEHTLKRALEFFIVQNERNELLREKVAVLHKTMIADRIVSLGLLSAGLSHHIRNALVAVKTFLDLAPVKMREEKGDPGTLRNPEFWNEYHANVQRQIDKINSMLRELGTASERPSFCFRDRVRLHDVIAEAGQKLQESVARQGVRVENNVSPSLPVLTVDGPKFQQLFELLLKDELVSLPAGATITFSAELQVRPGRNEPEIQIVIRDDGPGLSSESLRLLFDPFVVRSDSPMEYGLNLMACYFITHYHGGRIEARNEEGQGTTFTIQLPLDPNRLPPVEDRPEFLKKILRSEVLWEKVAGG